MKGKLVGVDISEHRMNTCRSILKKYGHHEVFKILFNIRKFWNYFLKNILLNIYFFNYKQFRPIINFILGSNN